MDSSAQSRPFLKIKLNYQALHAAVDAHGSVFNAVEEMGRKMGASLEVGREKSELLQRMDKLTERWNSIKVADEAVK